MLERRCLHGSFQGRTTVARPPTEWATCVPPEAVADTDVVVCHVADYMHDAGVEIGNRVGPDLVLSGW